MDNAQLTALKATLLAEKARLEEELDRLMIDTRENAADQSAEGSPSEMADIASDVTEQERIMSEREEVRSLLNEIDKALLRFENGTYGLSVVSGKPIPFERLEALPWASKLVGEEK
ncbi:MAG: hypothetical protein HXX08_10505 [Chloroflexi bacterium]|uniref:DksA C4-type domain-containing protein n=1 Tax=Candidatus Chlorohelix allophototropha TaxID=3003348 RepID=A0A8T7M3A8_9CHLR|nr:hypothetical protein [Chloroflexota bacterium]WJW65667.1 hypothetical protein OZ401_001445 [Chloroflexota bacterium L227-S17]